MNEFASFIREFGFPSFAFLVMVWFNVRALNGLTKAMDKLSEHIQQCPRK